MQTEMVSGQVLLHFAWKNPLGAAVFRRGEAVWVVFDAPARLDVSAAPHGFRQAQQVQAVQGADFSAVRIASPADVGVSAVAQGAIWTVILRPGQPPVSAPVKVVRDEAATSAALSATMAGATRSVWIDDPAVGDKIGVVTAMAPCKGLDSRREFVDLTLLPTVQGLAIEPIADGLAVTTDGDVVSIGMPNGLQLSPKAAQAEAAGVGPWACRNRPRGRAWSISPAGPGPVPAASWPATTPCSAAPPTRPTAAQMRR